MLDVIIQITYFCLLSLNLNVPKTNLLKTNTFMVNMAGNLILLDKTNYVSNLLQF